MKQSVGRVDVHYLSMGIMGVIIAMMALGRFFLEIDKVPEWSRTPLYFGVLFVSTTSILGSLLLFFVRRNILKRQNYHACIIASRVLFLLIPMGLIFGLFSLHQLNRKEVRDEMGGADKDAR